VPGKLTINFVLPYLKDLFVYLLNSVCYLLVYSLSYISFVNNLY